MLKKNELIEKIKEINSFNELNKMQKEALKHLNNNLLVSSPTSSGKTLVAEFFALNTILNKKLKVFYTCPLKALANEHYNSFKKKYCKEFNIKAALSIGDLDSASKYLDKYDIIFTTYEKLDSLIRHNAYFLYATGLLVIDEIHFIDSDRGPIIETSYVMLKEKLKELQVLALSATIPNAEEIAEWLDAKLVLSKERPVILKKAIAYDNIIEYEDFSKKELNSKNTLEELVKDAIEKNKQCLIFANTRKSAQAIAKKLSKKFGIENKISFETKNSFDEECLETIKKSFAFHHAGVRSEIRNIIEEEFKKGTIKAISSTPTLAAGVNLPAFRVIINSLYRHSNYGMRFIPVRDYLQMAGRAGRKGYDSYGEAIILTKDNMRDIIFEKYIFAEPENVYSNLGNISVLRTIILSLIANNFVKDESSLKDFFSKTLFARQFYESDIYNNIYDIINELIEFNFIYEENKELKANELGKRVSELYIDPLSAYNIINYLPFLKRHLNDYSMLYCLINTVELKPYFNIPAKIKKDIALHIDLNKDLFLDDPYLIFEDYSLSKKYFMMLVFYEWINESSEEKLYKDFSVMPGIMQSKIESLRWLAYSLKELALVIDKKEYSNIIKEANYFDLRLKYGVKKELLFLVNIENIGRKRARKLYNAGIKSISDIKKADTQKLEALLGKKTAEKLKKASNVF